MKKIISIILLSSFFIKSITYAEPPTNYGAKGALQDSVISLNEALTYSIQDEYLAQARYDAILSKFGDQRPFSQIKEAEKRHIQALLPLFAKHMVNAPKNNAKKFVDEPTSLKDALKSGVQAEKDNIAMYNKFINTPTIPGDVKTVFTNLRNASLNHLAAFEKGLSKLQ